VHETGEGLELAFSTPRAWLRPGGRIAIGDAPTRFGPVSFTIEAHAGSADVTLEPPTRTRPHSLALRLRLPGGKQIASVTLGGRPYGRFDAASSTIDLSGRNGRLQLRVTFRG
jgi:hypothetical protein